MANSGSAKIFRISAVAIFSALSFVLSAFCAIPYAGGAGYFNFGDVAALFAAMAFGPIEGALVGVIGGTLSDLFLGYVGYAPFTIIAKCLMGLAAGFLFSALKKHNIIRFVSPFVGSLLMVGTYLVAYVIYLGWGSLLSSAFDLIQGLGCSAVAVSLYLILEKAKLLPLRR